MYQYKASILRVVDGDTMDASVDLGFNTFSIMRLRLTDINTEELTNKDLEKRALAFSAKERVEKIIQEKGVSVTINTLKDRKEKYGRYLAKVTFSDGSCLNDILVQEGLATKYER